MSLPQIFSAIKRLRGGLPTTGVVIDLETSGLNTRRDQILQIGHCVLEGGKVTDRGSFFLDWTRHPQRTGVDPAEVKRAIEKSSAEIRAKGNAYHTDFDRLLVEGHDPYTVIRDYARLILDLKAADIPVLGHNAARFDSELLSCAFSRLAGDLAPGLPPDSTWEVRDSYWFPENSMIDTGTILKASQLNDFPYPNETLRGFSKRIGQIKRRGLLWSLDRFAIPTFGLAEKYGLDMSLAHDAGQDALATAYLYQELLARSGVQ